MQAIRQNNEKALFGVSNPITLFLLFLILRKYWQKTLQGLSLFNSFTHSKNRIAIAT